MSEKTTKVRTTQRIVNPAHDPRKSDSDAVFAPGAEVTVLESLAQKWINGGQAEAVETEAEAKVDEPGAAKPGRKRNVD